MFGITLLQDLLLGISDKYSVFLCSSIMYRGLPSCVIVKTSPEVYHFGLELVYKPGLMVTCLLCSSLIVRFVIVLLGLTLRDILFNWTKKKKLFLNVSFFLILPTSPLDCLIFSKF